MFAHFVSLGAKMLMYDGYWDALLPPSRASLRLRSGQTANILNQIRLYKTGLN